MANKEIKFKEIEESDLILTEVVERYIGGDGRNYVKTQKKIAKGEVNLGSLKTPNNKIAQIQYRTNNPNPFKNLFDGLK